MFPISVRIRSVSVCTSRSLIPFPSKSKIATVGLNFGSSTVGGGTAVANPVFMDIAFTIKPLPLNVSEEFPT